MGEAYEPMGYGPNVGDIYFVDDGRDGAYQVMQTPSGPVRIQQNDIGSELQSVPPTFNYYQTVNVPSASSGVSTPTLRQVTQEEAWSPTFAPTATTYEQIAPSIQPSFANVFQKAAPAPVVDRSAELAQFAGGMLNRGPIGVPQVALGGNYGPMYSMPNAGAQPFSFINPGSGGLLGNAMGNGSMGSAQPFGGPIGGGLLGGAK